MSFYPEKISKSFRAPKNVGKASEANAAGTNATFVCGAVLRFTLRINCQNREIESAKFKTNGCGYVIAAADELAERVVGKRMTDLRGFSKEIIETELENECGAFPERREHCLKLVTEALQAALADFRLRQIEEFTGEKALICSCFGVSEETIETLIKKDSLATIEEVTDACRAGGGCGSCQPLIQEIIDSTR